MKIHKTMKIKSALLALMLLSFLMGCKRTTEETSHTVLTVNKVEPNIGAIRIACIGNSITEGDGIQAREKDSYPAQMQTILGADYHVRNFGVSGRTLLRNGDFPYWNETAFQEAKDFQPDIVIIKLGTNDTKSQNWAFANEFVKDYQVFIDVFQALDSKPMVYLCYPVPAFEIRWGIDNKVITEEVMPKIKKVANSKELKIIDLYAALEGKKEFFPDGIHPNEAGAKVIAETVAQQILKKK